jgi:TnpA family transposase
VKRQAPSDTTWEQTRLSCAPPRVAVLVINATVRDATHVLDGLLYHESDLRIEEHYTDTAGFTDHVFALCHLLGFRFAPRSRDLADKRIYILEKGSAYPALLDLSAAR